MLNENGLEQKDEMPSPMVSRPTALSNLSKSQKIMAASLAFFAMAILILWTVNFKKTLSGSMTQTEDNNADQTSQTLAEDSTASQKLKDTDKDGLNDYDELNIYKTSPYLEDSDSDGINDKQEIDTNTDPNCPTGRNCSDTSLTSPSADDKSITTGTTDQSTLNNLLNQLGYNQAIGTATPSAVVNSGATTPLNSNMDAASLRQLLLQNGMQKAMLDQISDDQLLKSFQEIMAGQ